ncbi:AAA family ATPase [Variovorax sp. H27-G14]|uniref:AAA family ATPase n=1 Tax=Variovorax sp. H27-G14 TaxID=3111914 RepID=UPI0038FCEC6F
MVQPWDRAGARGKDPFAQLDRALRQHADAASGQLFDEQEAPAGQETPEGQEEQDAPEGFEWMGGLPPIDTTPESVEEPDVTMEFLAIRLPFARHRAAETGVTLLFDAMICQACAGAVFLRVRAAGYWQYGCDQCGTLLPRREVTKVLGQVAELAAATLPTRVQGQPPQVGREQRDWVKVFRLDDLADPQAMATLNSSDEHAQARLKATVQRLVKSSTVRHLAVPSQKWRTQLDDMREQFPNFERAIDEVIAPSLAVAAAGGRTRPAPLLLVGPPGCGKSFFASRLATMLRTPTFQVDMSAASIGAVLDGLAVYWGNSAPGLVFKTLAWGRGGVQATANPIAVLDELDKVAVDQRHDPLAALYTLLEVETAARFEDQSLPGILVDASHIRWVCCANDTGSIPKPLLSRMHVVQIEAPTQAQVHGMFERVFENLVSEMLLISFEKSIPTSVLERVVGGMSVREFKTRAGMAVGRALVAGRRCVQAEDFEIARIRSVPKMGF